MCGGDVILSAPSDTHRRAWCVLTYLSYVPTRIPTYRSTDRSIDISIHTQHNHVFTKSDDTRARYRLSWLHSYSIYMIS
eukprot:scaffold936_cov106-Amphora_coffeaeformis.AAC.8